MNCNNLVELVNNGSNPVDCARRIIQTASEIWKKQEDGCEDLTITIVFIHK